MAVESVKQISKTSYKTDELRPLIWDDDKACAKLIDQRILPYELTLVEISSVEAMGAAIKDMVLRGAPLIGIAAAYGMALAARAGFDLCEADKLLRSTRPTAVNLMWALDQVQAVIQSCTLDSRETIYQKILAKAHWILEDDIARCKTMSSVGAEYIKTRFNSIDRKSVVSDCQMQGTRSTEEPKFTVVNEAMRCERNTAVGNQRLRILTHCNAGALATGGYGTALGVIRTLAAEGLVEMVYADETRPRQQGARLTAWELAYDGIPVTLNTDNMAAHLMKQGLIDLVITGADRITANGDVANKIGTYGLAILAKYHDIPFYVAAPESTIDRSLAHGDQIIIEERDSSEVSHINGESCTAAQGVCFVNPGFDVTPRELIEAIFTEQGVL